MSSAVQFDLSPSPEDAISSINFAPNSYKILVSSWDRNVYLYDAEPETGSQLIQKYAHNAPVLGTCFGDDDTIAYTAGLDHNVRRLDLKTANQQILSTHAAGVKSLVYSSTHNLLISASWDRTVHIHLTNTETSTPATLHLPNKPFALTITSTTLIIAMSARLFHLYSLSDLASATSASSTDTHHTITVNPFQARDSSLKFMTRALAPMPDGQGYASSSIEGRVAVEWIDGSEEAQARKYAFKCHRQKAADTEGKDVVYPVHALAFHPSNGTFVTGGGDGTVAVWDVLAKRRIRQYKAFPSSVAALQFSGDGGLLAIATSPGFEEGKENVEEGTVKVFVRLVREDEGKDDKKKGNKKQKEDA